MTDLYQWYDGQDLSAEQKRAIRECSTGQIITIGGQKIPLVAICHLAAMSMKKPKAKLRRISASTSTTTEKK